MAAESDPARPPRPRRRRAVALTVAGVAAVASAGGVLLATSIRSPAQLAAETAPPPLTQLSAPVTRQVITGTVQAPGVVKPPPEVAELSGPWSAALAVVTRTVLRRGATVQPGQVIVEVSGRPLFAFPGAVPAYRDLVPGDTGADVAQLQRGLAAIGYPKGFDTAGTFGAGTAAAVAAFYTALGYAVPNGEPMVPRAEIMFVPRFPAQVVKVAGPAGKQASGSLATLSMGPPAVVGQLSPTDGALIKAGMAVTVTDPATGLARRGRIVSVALRTTAAHSRSGGVYLPATIRMGRPLPLSMIGQDVSLSIVAAHSAGAVLAVPEAAIFARADGRLYVTKVTGTGAGTGTGTSVQVPVRILVTGNGLVGVAPAGGGTLAAGDRVAIGADCAPAPGNGS
jgi:peptidoglycan hydrolase-like protein with peptidoglycan-binding domain